MREERGSALVQVLVMSVLLTVLATGVMKVMFMNHVAVAKVQQSDRAREAVEKCYAMRTVEWADIPCGPPTGSSDCVFPDGWRVTVQCLSAGRVEMKAIAPP